MATRDQLQVSIPPELLKNVDHYRKENSVSRSQAGKELIELGHRIWQQGQGDDASDLSTADLLKQLLQSSYSIQAYINMTASKHLAITDNEDGEPYPSAPLIKEAGRLAASKVEALLHPDKDE